MAEELDWQDLRAFAIVAGELNMRRAAIILHISQPPLSRKIKKLEERLGAELFLRHSQGLELTPAGREALQIVRPLLAMLDEAQKKLEGLAPAPTRAIGLTTAFEQGIYAPLLRALRKECGAETVIRRASSIQLAKAVSRGELAAALVALPMPLPGVGIIDLRYGEPLLALLPDKWPVGEQPINLADFAGRPFFWFSPWRNPFWHERMQAEFARLKFAPRLLEEPAEHDVLLSRVAAGEGFALLPQSFAAISRGGTRFAAVADLPPLALGVAFRKGGGESFAQKCAALT